MKSDSFKFLPKSLEVSILFRSFAVEMNKNINIHEILSGGERVTLECKKATKGVPSVTMGHLFCLCQYLWWYNFVRYCRAYERARQCQTI